MEQAANWSEVLDQAQDIRSAVEAMPPPPMPDNTLSELMSTLNNASGALLQYMTDKTTAEAEGDPLA